MTKPFKFLCFADAHLDPEKYGPRGREIRKRDALAAFGKLIDTALAENVDLVGCAGDFFDRSTVDPWTLIQVEHQLGRLKAENISFVVIQGNHDRPHANYLESTSWLSYLMRRDLIILLNSLDPHGVRFYQGTEHEVQVFGIPFAGSQSGERIKELGDYIERQTTKASFPIVLLHLGVDVVTDYGADVTVEQLAPLTCAKLLCTGHIHQRAEFAFGTGTPVYNPGSLTVCNVDEIEQEHGYYIYTIHDDHSFEAEYFEAEDRPFEVMVYDLRVFYRAEKFMELVAEETDELSKLPVEKMDNKPILHLYLKGELKFPHADLNVNAVQELFAETDHYELVIFHDETTAQGMDLLDRDIHSGSRNELIKGILEQQAEGDDPEQWASYCQQLERMLIDGTDYAQIMSLTEDYIAKREQINVA